MPATTLNWNSSGNTYVHAQLGDDFNGTGEANRPFRSLYRACVKGGTIVASASTGPVAQGNVGAGTGTVCFGWKGGIGTSSRILPESLGGWTVGVLVQSNYGGILEIDGVPVGKRLGQYEFKKNVESGSADGSCMMVIITDAPLDARNLERVAKRAVMGLAKTGGIASNGSGDYVIALSVAPGNLVRPGESLQNVTLLSNDRMSPLFEATIEATAEALWNSLFMAETLSGNGSTVKALPVPEVLKMLRKIR